jgi:hypothetical protein
MTDVLLRKLVNRLPDWEKGKTKNWQRVGKRVGVYSVCLDGIQNLFSEYVEEFEPYIFMGKYFIKLTFQVCFSSRKFRWNVEVLVVVVVVVCMYICVSHVKAKGKHKQFSDLMFTCFHLDETLHKRNISWISNYD